MFIGFDDTIAAPATIPGTGALTVIRVSGRDCFSTLSKVVRFRSGDICDFEGYTIHYGEVFGKDGGLLDEVLVSVFRAPHSYTGEDSAEISCHGSAYIAGEILGLLHEAGARPAEPGEFTRRSFMNGKMDLAQAEAVADLISSNASASHRLAVNQLKGGVSEEISALREELSDIGALLELELDFSEEDVEFADRARLVSLIDEVVSHVCKVASSFRDGNALREGIPVAIAGDVNSGKSTLLNALLSEDRAIVSDIPGTTRDTVEEFMTVGPFSFRLIDTAGLRETDESVEKAGIKRTLRKVSESDFVIAVLDLTREPEVLRESLSSIVSSFDKDCQTLILAFNKADLMSEIDINKNVNILNNFVLSSGYKADSMVLSAKDKIGIEDLKKLLEKRESEKISVYSSSIISNRRHYEALRNASDSLLRLKDGISLGLTSDLLAEDLRAALHHLGSITGHITDDEILGKIFGRFCIGK